MRLLLHTCCAPCLIYPLRRLGDEGFEVIAFFYNPNIHPFREYKLRKEALVELNRQLGIETILPEYKPSEFFQVVNLKEVVPQRCSRCWSLRLRATARTAKEKELEYFSTSLLVSPYQDQQLLHKIGCDIAEEFNVKFYYEDFRPGFKKAHEEAKAKGIYCQKYCGCVYSMSRQLAESEERRKL